MEDQQTDQACVSLEDTDNTMQPEDQTAQLTSDENNNMLNKEPVNVEPTPSQNNQTIHYIPTPVSANNVVTGSYQPTNTSIESPITSEALYQNSDSLLDEADVAKEAEEIVQKLCRNGKIMQFQEGEDFIKVIVYEDSQEDNNDNEDTASADETEKDDDNRMDAEKGGERLKPKNLLECLTESHDQYFRQLSTQTSTAEGNIQSRNSNVSQRYNNWIPSPSDPRTQSSATSRAEPLPSDFGQFMQGTAFLPTSMAHSSTQYVNMPVTAQNTSASSTTSRCQQTVMCTPHPSNGYMFFMPEGKDAGRTPVGHNQGSFSTPLSTSTSRTPRSTFQNVALNSSGEEAISPVDLTNTPVSHTSRNGHSMIPLPQFDVDECGKLREIHNQKERRRRARIKEACNLLRQLVPGMSDKTDKATVFEFAARYVHFLKSHTGNQFDKDFLMKYSPY